MIASLSKSGTYEDKLGNKGGFLLEMLNAGFPVPEGFILDSDEYDAFIEQNGIKDKLLTKLKELDKENAAVLSQELTGLFDNAALSGAIQSEIAQRAEKGVLYAVRSSGTM